MTPARCPVCGALIRAESNECARCGAMSEAAHQPARAVAVVPASASSGAAPGGARMGQPRQSRQFRARLTWLMLNVLLALIWVGLAVGSPVAAIIIPNPGATATFGMSVPSLTGPATIQPPTAMATSSAQATASNARVTATVTPLTPASATPAASPTTPATAVPSPMATATARALPTATFTPVGVSPTPTPTPQSQF